MTCSNSAATRLHFVQSGIKVIPQRATIETDHGNYDHARIQVSREAGGHIVKNGVQPETVNILVDGEQIRRLMVPEDGIKHEKDTSTLHLVDPRYGLEKGSVDYRNGNISFGEAVEWLRGKILNERKEDINPNGIINDVRASDGSDLQERSKDWMDESEGRRPVLYDGPGPNVNDITRWTLEQYDATIGLSRGEDGGIDFENTSFAKALRFIENEWSVTSWMDRNGVLWIGPEGSRQSIYYAGRSEEMWSISEYNVNARPIQAKHAYVKGDYLTRQGPHKETYQPNQSDKVRVVGYATVGEVDPSEAIVADMMDPNKAGRVLSKSMQTVDSDTLERNAKKMLLEAVYDDVAGNIVLNPTSSGSEFGTVQQLDVGDIIGTLPRGYESCSEDVPARAFGVNGITHEITPRNGWQTTVNVGMLPQSPIQTWSFESGLSSTEFTDGEEFYPNLQEQTENQSPRSSLADETLSALSNLI